MVESIDGRIDCGMVDKISGDEYYTTLDSLDCKASVEGRVTMEHYYALPEKFAVNDRTPHGKKEVFKSTDRNDFHICPDSHGTLQWGSGSSQVNAAVFGGGRHTWPLRLDIDWKKDGDGKWKITGIRASSF